MAEVKLFGTTIPVLAPVVEACMEENDKDVIDKDSVPDSKEKEDEESLITDETISNHASSKPGDIQKSSTGEDSPSSKNTNSEELRAGEKNKDQQEEQAPKKPDKILPCPRCDSLDTKFCYYNNYNLNQPRHFCKSCQRYWTAGGTMRNVPVGAGRRKNKCPSRPSNMVLHNVATLQSLESEPILANQNSVQLSFGNSETPLCKSMASSALNLAEKTMKNGIHNSFSPSVETNSEEHSASVSSVTISNSTEEGRNLANANNLTMTNCAGFAPWPCPWPPAPPLCATSFPIQFYPWPYLWAPAPPSSGSSMLTSASSSRPNSPALGKHSRDGTVLNHSITKNSSNNSNSNSEENGDNSPKKINREGGIWMPKTLRIHNPEEAAKSSIWASMGINKAFQTKEEMNCHSKSDASTFLLANPAAFSRSLSFQESS